MPRRPRSQVRGILRLPLLLLIWGIFAIAMWIPAIHAVLVDDHQTSQSFFYSGIVGLTFVTFIALSVANRVPRYGMPGQLMTLLATFVFLPTHIYQIHTPHNTRHTRNTHNTHSNTTHATYMQHT